MLVVYTEPFDFEGVHYEIRVVKKEEQYIVGAYKGDGEANGYEYIVREPTNFDFWQQFGFSGVQHLVDSAKDDVAKKRWEKYVKALKDLEVQKQAAAGSALYLLPYRNKTKLIIHKETRPGCELQLEAARIQT